MKKLRILITGASGYLGSKIYADLKDSGYDVIGTRYSNRQFNDLIQLDTTVKDDVFNLLDGISPDIIIHSAANASNSYCEDHPEEAWRINVDSTSYISDWSRKHKIKLILISTIGAINPTTIYGKTKLAAEKQVEKLDSYVILRPSLILGFSPNIEKQNYFNKVINALRNRDPEIEFDSIWQVYPTFIEEIVTTLRFVLENDSVHNITIPIFSDHMITQYSFAKELLSDYDILIKPVEKKDRIKILNLNHKIHNKLKIPYISYKKGMDSLRIELQKRLK